MVLSTKKINRNKGINKSYSYLIPLLNEDIKIDGNFYILLKNVFCRYNGKEGYIVICYEDGKTESFNEYIVRLHSDDLFVESFDEDDGLIYLVFRFPDTFMYEYKCYMQGKYSKFRESAKQLIVAYILEVHNNISAESVRKVLYKDPSLRASMESLLECKLDDDTELSSKPVLANESCFNYSEME